MGAITVCTARSLARDDYSTGGMPCRCSRRHEFVSHSNLVLRVKKQPAYRHLPIHSSARQLCKPLLCLPPLLRPLRPLPPPLFRHRQQRPQLLKHAIGIQHSKGAGPLALAQHLRMGHKVNKVNAGTQLDWHPDKQRRWPACDSPAPADAPSASFLHSGLRGAAGMQPKPHGRLVRPACRPHHMAALPCHIRSSPCPCAAGSAQTPAAPLAPWPGPPAPQQGSLHRRCHHCRLGCPPPPPLPPFLPHLRLLARPLLRPLPLPLPPLLLPLQALRAPLCWRYWAQEAPAWHAAS